MSRFFLFVKEARGCKHPDECEKLVDLHVRTLEEAKVKVQEWLQDHGICELDYHIERGDVGYFTQKESDYYIDLQIIETVNITRFSIAGWLAPYKAQAQAKADEEQDRKDWAEFERLKTKLAGRPQCPGMPRS
jgi:hypothetical protein